MAMPLRMIASIRTLMSCRPNFQHVRSRARSHGPDPRPTIRTITRASWLPSTVHAPVRDEVSGGVPSMPMHRRLVGEFIAFLVHEQAIPVAHVHVVAHPLHACP